MADINEIKGKYKFIKNFIASVCSQYQGSMGIVNPCIKYKNYNYKIGDVIDVQTFYFSTEKLGNLPIKEQNLGVPMSYLEKVNDSTSVSKERVDYSNEMKSSGTENGTPNVDEGTVLCNNGSRDITNGKNAPCSGIGSGGVATNQNPQSQNQQVSFLESHPKLLMAIFIGIGLYIGYKKFIK